MTTAEDSWRSAATLKDLGELAARWLEGDLAFNPTYGNEPDPETSSLTGVLSRLNRAGFFTESSQPGELNESWAQRAFVSGYADDELSSILRGVLVSTELVVVVIPPGVDNTRSQIVVSREGFEEITWVGMGLGKEELHHQYSDSVGAGALAARTAAWQLEIFDPAWGRNDRLWPSLEVVLDALV